MEMFIETVLSLVPFLAVGLPFFLPLLYLHSTILRRAPLRCWSTGALSALIGSLITVLIRATYYKPRPFVIDGVTPLIPHTANAAFPSLHAAVVFGIAFPLLTSNRKLGIAAVALAALISIARVAAGVHDLWDIGGGAVLGIVIAMATQKFLAPIGKPNKQGKRA